MLFAAGYVIDETLFTVFAVMVGTVVAAVIAVLAVPDRYRGQAKVAAITGFSIFVLLAIFLLWKAPLQPVPSSPIQIVPTAQAQDLNDMRKMLIEAKDKLEKCQHGSQGASTSAASGAPSNKPESSDASLKVPGPCETSTAKAISAMVARCGSYNVCPANVTLGETTPDEYTKMMASLDHVVLFFETDRSDGPRNGMAEFEEFAKTFTEKSTAIIVSRASRTGPPERNRELSRLRAVFANQQLKGRTSYSKVVPASYGEETLYLTEKDADVYKIDPTRFADVQHLNQSVFIFRFDCP